MYIRSLSKHKSRTCSSEFSHFLSTMTSKTKSKDTEKRIRNAVQITVLTMAETVNSSIHCKTNYYAMTFPFVIFRELLEKDYLFWSTIVARKMINFNCIFLLCCANTAVRTHIFFSILFHSRDLQIASSRSFILNLSVHVYFDSSRILGYC